MPSIVINEISQNYSYNIGNSSYCTVALPITACWGPGYSTSSDVTDSDTLENLHWEKFPANQSGLEAFVSTFRGPSTIHRASKDYSYQMAMTLLTSGYDLLVCRISSGKKAAGKFEAASGDTSIDITAKYPGTFGNSLKATLAKVADQNYWNMIVYVTDSGSGNSSAVENIVFCLDEDHSTVDIPHISEIESSFVDLTATGPVTDADSFTTTECALVGGNDQPDDFPGETDQAKTVNALQAALASALARYNEQESASTHCSYISQLIALKNAPTSISYSKAATIAYKEKLYNCAVVIYGLLKDKLAYNPNRIISPGWDDQCFSDLGVSDTSSIVFTVSPIHSALMDAAFGSRCATALIDVPKDLPRSKVYSDGNPKGYAQQLSAAGRDNAYYATHSGLFAPWGQYLYVGNNKMQSAPPSFLALMIQRAMILNQPLQYEWAMPSSRKHNLSIGKLDYTVPKKYLDMWQGHDGVGVNVITSLPELGTGLWGNSTLYNVPPATYQALANLSTRYLVNAIENIAYKAGISITFQYNNNEAYSRFYAAVTPILDTMKNVGAIDDYYVRMSADINGLDQVNANTVVGKIYLVVNGVVNNIVVDLIALPPQTNLDQFRS